MSSIIKVNTVQDTDGNNIINENANTITIGKSGDTVTVAGGATFVGGGIQWQSSIVTGATHTAGANQGLWLDTSSNAITLTLPASPSVGDQVVFTDYARNWGTNAVTLSLNGSKFQGSTSPNPVYDTNGESVDIVYSGSTKGWIPNSDGAVALETPQFYNLEYLIIGGGGAGGKLNSGGGGAGGYLTNFGGTPIQVSPGTVYTVTVGAKGAATTSNSVNGGNGGDSSLTGSDITNITATGGGGGSSAANGSNAGSTGGSGGGSASGVAGAAGNTPSTTPSQGNNGGSGFSGANSSGGGGGGAGSVGETAPQGRGGNGGNGLSSSITGSAVTRAGGGGGVTEDAGGDMGTAGSGGATAGSYNGTPPAPTANSGSGGGATHNGGTSGEGAVGVVILSVPDANYSGTTTGSPTVATGVSGKTVMTFTGSGSYTA
jgi:hypothetical protein